VRRGALVRVRRARSADVPALVALFQELDGMQRDWRVFTPRPGFYDEIGRKYREALDHPDALLAVAEDDGQIVGMAYAEIHTPSRSSNERAIELSSVVVRADRRRAGVGRALVREVVRFSAERDVPWVELKTFSPNRGAMEFWESLGFTPRVVQLTAPVGRLSEHLAGS
ncbi:MAG: N-acetyltransferase family protein, partial [Actinomycetota bacterium]